MNILALRHSPVYLTAYPAQSWRFCGYAEGMSALWWLAIPVVATSVAIGYVVWTGREHRIDPLRSTDNFERFRRAMEKRRRD